MKFGFSKKLAYTTLLAGLAAPAALAQTPDSPFFRNRFVAVTDRPQPEFDPQPVRLGSFILNSSLGLGVGYNDNVFSTENNETSDTYFQLNPHAELQSDWANHSLSLGFDVNDTQFSSESDESTVDGEGHINGRLDVTREFALGAGFSGARYHQPRNDPGSPGAAVEPIEFGRSQLNGNATWTRSRFQLRGEVGQIDMDYKDVGAVGGGRIDQDFRDSTEDYFSVRGTYAVSPDVAVFLDGRFSNVDYDDPGTVLNPTRDSDQTNIHVGLDFELEAPFRGDVGIGYLTDDKKSALRPDFDGISLDGRLIWFPTQITTVTFTGVRTTFDPGLFTSATASLTAFGVHIDHELRRNIVLFGDLRHQDSDFEGIDRKDSILTFAVGGGYKLNRNARVDLTYTLLNQDSSGAQRDRDLSQNKLSLTLRLFP